MDKQTVSIETGVVHGRFQPLHNDHLRYLLAAKRLCRYLVVGITNPDPLLTRDDPADTNRSSTLSNPFTFYERHSMIRSALVDAGVPLSDFSPVPLPVNFPELYRYYVPMDAVFFITIYDDWGRKKLHFFTSLGLKIHVLREVRPEDKGISGSDVRQKILGGDTWEHLVPRSTAALIKKWRIHDRLLRLQNSCAQQR